MSEVLVEAVEEWLGHREHLVVAAHHREPAAENIESSGFWRIEPIVLKIRLVNDASHVGQHWVTELVAAEHGFERAVVTVL